MSSSSSTSCTRHGCRRLFHIVFNVDTHFQKPLLHHFVYEAVVTNKPALVLGFVITRRTFEDIALLQTLAKSLSEVTIGKVAQKHITPAKVAFTQRTRLAHALGRLELLQDFRVKTVLSSLAFVQNSHHGIVLGGVVTDEHFDILGVKLASGHGAGKGRPILRQLGPQLLGKMFIGHVSDKVCTVEECSVANLTCHRRLFRLGLLLLGRGCLHI